MSKLHIVIERREGYSVALSTPEGQTFLLCPTSTELSLGAIYSATKRAGAPKYEEPVQQGVQGRSLEEDTIAGLLHGLIDHLTGHGWPGQEEDAIFVAHDTLKKLADAGSRRAALALANIKKRGGPFVCYEPVQQSEQGRTLKEERQTSNAELRREPDEDEILYSSWGSWFARVNGRGGWCVERRKPVQEDTTVSTSEQERSRDQFGREYEFASCLEAQEHAAKLNGAA